jgi:peptidoglycan hydrolase-like protein with peptidoglycan-binding domain
MQRAKMNQPIDPAKGSIILATVILSESIGLNVPSAWSQDPRTRPSVAGKIESRHVQPLEKAKGDKRMSAEDIKRLEEALQERLHDPGRIDGIIDQRTRDALREFQMLNNLPVTGVVDEQTAAKLGGVRPE